MLTGAVRGRAACAQAPRALLAYILLTRRIPPLWNTFLACDAIAQALTSTRSCKKHRAPVLLAKPEERTAELSARRYMTLCSSQLLIATNYISDTSGVQQLTSGMPLHNMHSMERAPMRASKRRSFCRRRSMEAAARLSSPAGFGRGSFGGGPLGDDAASRPSSAASGMHGCPSAIVPPFHGVSCAGTKHVLRTPCRSPLGHAGCIGQNSNTTWHCKHAH